MVDDDYDETKVSGVISDIVAGLAALTIAGALLFGLIFITVRLLLS